MRWMAAGLVFLVCGFVRADGFSIPAGCRQLIVTIAADWDSSRATLQRYERNGGAWRPVGEPVPVRLGREGLVWGRGLHPVPDGAPRKRERDWRAPAGVFDLRGVYGYAADCERHPGVPYRQITARDLWIDDPASPQYNQHALLPHEAPRTDWERRMQMKQGDHPHSLKLFIGHNAPPRVERGAGSAIFFHIWRDGGAKPSSGCTTMPEPALREIIAWMNPAKQPLYVLLPRAEYERFRAAWNLP